MKHEEESRCCFVMRDREGEEYPCGAVQRIHGSELGKIFTHEFVPMSNSTKREPSIDSTACAAPEERWLTELYERSKSDNEIIVGSEVREVISLLRMARNGYRAALRTIEAVRAFPVTVDFDARPEYLHGYCDGVEAVQALLSAEDTKW